MKLIYYRTFFKEFVDIENKNFFLNQNHYLCIKEKTKIKIFHTLIILQINSESIVNALYFRNWKNPLFKQKCVSKMNLVKEEWLKYIVWEGYQKGLSGKRQNNVLQEKTQWENAMYYRLKSQELWIDWIILEQFDPDHHHINKYFM